MISVVKKPNFFPGQLIDFRDLNRIVFHAEDLASHLIQLLFQGGGIISGAFQEFRIQKTGNLTVKILPGVALLPDGKICVLSSEMDVDLSQFKLLQKESVVSVGIKAVNQGEDHCVDPDDPSISGYRTGVWLPEVVFSVDHELASGVELFRVRMDSSVLQLEERSNSLQWDEPKLGQINFQHRKKISVQSNFPGPNEAAPTWRSSLIRLNLILDVLQKRTLLGDRGQVSVFVSLLHSEILVRPFQLKKAAFLIEEIAERLSLYLERVVTEGRDVPTKLNSQSILQVIVALEKLRVRELEPEVFKMEEFIQVIDLLDRLVGFSQAKTELMAQVQAVLSENKNCQFEFHPQMTWAGHVFEKVDEVHSLEQNRLGIASPSNHSRVISATYSNGDQVNHSGVFIPSGEISMSISSPKNDRPLIILLKSYIRRGEIEVQCEWNGKVLSILKLDDSEGINRWCNQTILVPRESLLKGENQFTLKVVQTEHDYGFFRLAAYQAHSESLSEER